MRPRTRRIFGATVAIIVAIMMILVTVISAFPSIWY